MSLTPQELVVLVDEMGQPIGECLKAVVHGTDTPLHLAFSVHIFDYLGRVLVTRRALSKRTWPGVWTNTCCGHPAPGESITDAVRRRLYFELGLDAPDLRCVLPDFAYKAIDASGVVENEICPVLIGFTDQIPEINPREVAEVKWVSWPQILLSVENSEHELSPWAIEEIKLLSDSEILRRSFAQNLDRLAA